MASDPTPPTCKTCPYWCDMEMDDVGECRRRPPCLPALPEHVEISHELSDSPLYGMFPETSAREWCGEHPDFPRFLGMRSLSPRDELPAGTMVDPSS